MSDPEVTEELLRDIEMGKAMPVSNRFLKALIREIRRLRADAMEVRHADCPPAITLHAVTAENVQLRAELAKMADLLRECLAAVEHEDPRMDYVTVQVSKAARDEARDLIGKWLPKEVRDADNG
jgi:wyosine [tRNA(Phe)-imidazoG37] synthetase (radical SAM superfamily)